MQTKDIIADGTTEYAYAEEWEWNSRYPQRQARRVVVHEKGIGRRSYSYGSQTVKNGVTIGLIGDDGKEVFRKTVRSAEIRELWGPYVIARDAADKAKRERESASAVAHKALLDRIKATLPEGTKLPYWTDSPSGTSVSPSGRLSMTELVDLLEAAYASGERHITEMM